MSEIVIFFRPRHCEDTKEIVIPLGSTVTPRMQFFIDLAVEAISKIEEAKEGEVYLVSLRGLPEWFREEFRERLRALGLEQLARWVIRPVREAS